MPQNWKGEKVEVGKEGTVGKGQVPETDGVRATGRIIPHNENATKHKTPAVSGTKRTTSSHREAAASQQKKTNE